MEAQKAASEAVGSLESQMQRLRVTSCTRISDLNSTHFEHHIKSAKKTQMQMVEAAAFAWSAYAQTGGMSTATEISSIVDESIVAFMNDLMLSESSERFFGVSVPDMELQLCKDTFYDDAIGLLCYRAWQLLLRTKRGRRIVAFADDSTEKLDDPNYVSSVDCDSYKTIHTALAAPILGGRQIDFFERCILALPVTSTDASFHNSPSLTKTEKSKLLCAIRNSALDWAIVKTRNVEI